MKVTIYLLAVLDEEANEKKLIEAYAGGNHAEVNRRKLSEQFPHLQIVVEKREVEL